MRLARSAADQWTRSACLAYTTLILWGRDTAHDPANLDEAITLARTVGDPWLLMHSLFFRGRFHRNMLELEVAAGWYREALSIVRSIDDRTWTSATLHELTDCHVGLANPGPARDFLLEGVRLCKESGAKGFLVMFLGSMAGVAKAEEKGRKSVRLISAWSELAGVPDSWPSLAYFRKSSGLDDAACDAEAAIGRAMSLEEALALGMSEE